MSKPKVYVSDMQFEESSYIRGDSRWMASTLYDKAKADKLKPFDYPLAAFNMLEVDPFNLSNLKFFIFQCKRVLNCDTSIPIILDDYGQVADGYHRICKAILEGKTTIKAYRLQEMPPVDEYLKEDEL